MNVKILLLTTIKIFSGNNDVCTLEQAQEFKKLGIKQESAYYWDSNANKVVHRDSLFDMDADGSPTFISDVKTGSRYFSAYNTGELIAMVQPINIWSAQSFADLLLDCLRTKTLTVAEVNRRLDEFRGVEKE